MTFERRYYNWFIYAVVVLNVLIVAALTVFTLMRGWVAQAWLPAAVWLLALAYAAWVQSRTPYRVVLTPEGFHADVVIGRKRFVRWEHVSAARVLTSGDKVQRIEIELAHGPTLALVPPLGDLDALAAILRQQHAELLRM